MSKHGPGAELSDELYVGLAKARVPKEVIDALRAAMINSAVDQYALAYAHSMTESFDQAGVPGVQAQVLYMLMNMGHWRGEEARASKKLLNKWAGS